MSNGSTGQPSGRVPTLTEVVVLPDTPAVPMPMPLEADVMVPAPDAAVTPLQSPQSSQQATPIDEEEMIQRVLADVQHQVDLMLEYRLREVFTTILTRATDSVIREARSELASTLRDVVARAVAQEMSRHRSR